jgi:hypothetical protein
MPTSASRETLQARHSAISQKIQQEQSRPGSSDWLLKSLKRQKLHLKEQIEGIS